MRVEPRIINLRWGERPCSPIRFLMAFIHFDIQFLGKHVIQPYERITENSRRVHGIEKIFKRKTKITLQAEQVIFRGMKYFFDLRVAKQRAKRVQLIEDKWVENVISFRG